MMQTKQSFPKKEYGKEDKKSAVVIRPKRTTAKNTRIIIYDLLCICYHDVKSNSMKTSREDACSGVLQRR